MDDPVQPKANGPKTGEEDPPRGAQLSASPPTDQASLQGERQGGEADTQPTMCERALAAFDVIGAVIAGDDLDIRGLLEEARRELQDAYFAAEAGRYSMAFVMLRGVMEGLFTSLYYRQQRLSLNLWASNRCFHMVHQMLDPKHEFYMYYRALFEDERFKRDFPNISAKAIFEEACGLYEVLSRYVHKKSPVTRALAESDFQGTVERVFRIALSFLDREEELPTIEFPAPATFAGLLASERMKRADGQRKQ